ncbi:aminoglycoside phosphotransferase family protein [Cryobacterium sp. SO2]|uniref:aminoglycoside phosphotransferase family protein n=1 Tax=Cryobacterium sp. SO2 TaxID=1897060 RepID=UPI00223D1824|nr:aminoglycoside phosphotransferase family protein [Cryobacterium sp. SO2]WEO77168.1 aminoglycoside phosphotransferase family protein [Cryobacterium sp. SO2]
MDERTLTILRGRGWTPGETLGTGMEGTVVALSSDVVAKVWHGRDRADLLSLVRFGAALGRSSVPFRTSRALELLEGEGQPVTIEHRVHGRPVRLDNLVDPPIVSDKEARLMGDALAGLARGIEPGLVVLPILPGEPSFENDSSFAVNLADLTQWRLDAHSALLRQKIGDIDELVGALLVRLRALPTVSPASLIHGDLIPANILVEDDEVTGVVDFGFMTTLGDPAFDAAITASIFDMYGTNGRESERILSSVFLLRFGHDPMRYGLYRAAYAVITNSLFGVDDSDGHFLWCAAMLEREDVRNAILD